MGLAFDRCSVCRHIADTIRDEGRFRTVVHRPLGCDSSGVLHRRAFRYSVPHAEGAHEEWTNVVYVRR